MFDKSCPGHNQPVLFPAHTPALMTRLTTGVHGVGVAGLVAGRILCGDAAMSNAQFARPRHTGPFHLGGIFFMIIMGGPIVRRVRLHDLYWTRMIWNQIATSAVGVARHHGPDGG